MSRKADVCGKVTGKQENNHKSQKTCSPHRKGRGYVWVESESASLELTILFLDLAQVARVYNL